MNHYRLFVVLVLIFKKEDPPQIILIGNKEETVYQNETYNDPGYKVFNSDESILKILPIKLISLSDGNNKIIERLF